MIIPCFRCRKEIESPDSRNADYIMAEDTRALEHRGFILILVHNEATLAKLAQMQEVDGEGKRLYPGLAINDSEYDQITVSRGEEIAEATVGRQIVKVLPGSKPVQVQKTGIVCPDCYRPSDTIIWGVHKEGEGG